MSQLDKMKELGNKLVITAIAFNSALQDMCSCTDFNEVANKFDKVTDMLSAHTDVMDGLTTVCPAAMLEITQRGMKDLFNSTFGGDIV